MSVLVFVEASEGKFKKPAYEAATYGAKVSAMLGVEAHALCIDEADEAELKTLGDYGIKKVWFVKDARLKNFDPLVFAKVITQAEAQINADVLVLIQNYNGKAIAPVLSAKLRAGLVSGAIDLPLKDGNSFLVRKNVFSGKAFATYEMHSAQKIISLIANSVAPEKTENSAVLTEFKPELMDADFKITVKEVVKASGTISL
ncbi:MAG: electron transfer flavoprotein subunit alpha/FixB family protein, partial [Chitinophagales bacterium]